MEPTQTTTSPEVSMADMSLAEYRASREPAADQPAKEISKEPTHAGEETQPGESAADEKGAADDSPEQETEKGEPKRKGGWQRRIEKQEREIAELKTQLAGKPAGQRDEQAVPQAAETAAPAFEKAKPRLEDFDSIETFAEALTDWKLDKKDFERDAAAAQQKVQSETRQIVEQWNERKADFQKEHADYDERMEDVEDIPLSPAHQRLLLDSDIGPQLAYELAGDRELLEKFAGLHPIAAARELGKLEAQLSSTHTAPEKETKVSAAPRPIKPVASRASATASAPDLSKMSLSEYRRWRERAA